MHSKKPVESWSTEFYALGINKLISHWQKCADCNGSYLINKDVFEPSYNGVKFTVWNYNNFFYQTNMWAMPDCVTFQQRETVC